MFVCHTAALNQVYHHRRESFWIELLNGPCPSFLSSFIASDSFLFLPPTPLITFKVSQTVSGGPSTNSSLCPATFDHHHHHHLVPPPLTTSHEQLALPLRITRTASNSSFHLPSISSTSSVTCFLDKPATPPITLRLRKLSLTSAFPKFHTATVYFKRYLLLP